MALAQRSGGGGPKSLTTSVECAAGLSLNEPRRASGDFGERLLLLPRDQFGRHRMIAGQAGHSSASRDLDDQAPDDSTGREYSCGCGDRLNDETVAFVALFVR